MNTNDLELNVKVSFAVWNLFNTHNNENIMRFNYDVFTCESDSADGL